MSYDRVKVLVVVLGLGTGGAERSLVDMAHLMTGRGIDLEFECRVQLTGAQSDLRVPVRFSESTSFRAWMSEIRRSIRRSKPDIVHTQLFGADLAGRLAAAGTDVRVLSSLVNMSYEPERYADPMVRRWKLECTRAVEVASGRLFVDHFHAITTAVADSAVTRLHVRPEKISVVPRGRGRDRLGVRTLQRRESARQSLGLSMSCPVAMTLGREEFQKGHETAVTAAAELASQFPDLRLVMAGRRGSASPQLDEAIERSGMESRVLRLGHIGNVGDLLCAADLLLFPSRFEGLGGALVEAMALDTPIIASDIAPIREVVGGESGALLVPVDDRQALAEAAATVLEAPESAKTRTQFARRRFEERFTIEAVADQMADLYRKVAGRG